jgi:hypothetical protein
MRKICGGERERDRERERERLKFVTAGTEKNTGFWDMENHNLHSHCYISFT